MDHAEAKEDAPHYDQSYYDAKEADPSSANSPPPSTLTKVLGPHSFPTPPLNLPQFRQCYDDVKECAYLFHPRTGEVVYVENDHGDAAGVSRAFSCWTRPEEAWPGGGTNEEFRDDISWGRHTWRMREILLNPPPPPRNYTQEEAALCIQSLYRRVRDTAKLRYKLKAIYSKHYDPESFLCYFVNELTGATQWHRPVGLGQSAEHDIPEVGFELEATPDFVPIETHDLTLAPTNAVAIAEEKSTGYGDLESELGFSITSTPRRGNTPRKGKKVKKTYATLEGNQKYTVGPYCKRTKGTPGRNVTKALGNRKLNEAKEMMDENGRTGFGHPKDLDLDAELYGPDIPSLDGLVLRTVPVEPYMLLRGAHEHGVTAVLDMMHKYPKNRHVVLFGFLSLAKMDIVETEDGVASEECTRAVKHALLMIDEWTDNAAILAAALACLATISDNYANRIVINEEKWMPRIVKLMKDMETETNDLYIRFADGVKKIEVTSVTRQSIDLAIFGTKVLFNMSCDEVNREYVADSGSALVLYVMKYCDEDPTVQHWACLALYNFVYRNEPAHTILNEENVLEVLRKVESEFAGDDTLRKACKRTIAAMEPEGWRGNLATKFNDSIL
ncbi:hypothetical protein TeGR_g12017 [Tetraparma gracilis]|uniref:Uncharacterized protein n=1 Tax=Tetraparma gracilis TaxID=2962635 RepID=A0ABQ6MW83_9STRA|nr:hypothetical protein TeGR_g12017 [Tetraparma gracilis]